MSLFEKEKSYGLTRILRLNYEIDRLICDFNSEKMVFKKQLLSDKINFTTWKMCLETDKFTGNIESKRFAALLPKLAKNYRFVMLEGPLTVGDCRDPQILERLVDNHYYKKALSK